MKILLTGVGGLIGDYIYKNYSKKDKIIAPSKEELDILDSKFLASLFKKEKFDVVLHCAGATQILLGEKERGKKTGNFWKTNVNGLSNILENCSKNNSYLVYFSGEVVFSGKKKRPGPYKEDDLPDEMDEDLSWYGQTKKKAENLIRENYKNSAIVRVGSVVGKGSQPRPDYARKILDNYFSRSATLPRFDDQYISLAANDELLRAVSELLWKKRKGTYHVASRDRFTPFELTNYLISKLLGKRVKVKKASLDEFLQRGVSFPKNSGLSVRKTENALGIRFSTWKTMVDRLIPELRKLYIIKG